MSSLIMDSRKEADLREGEIGETRAKPKSEEYLKWAHLLAARVPLFLVKKQNSKFFKEKWIVNSGKVMKVYKSS